MQIRKKIWKCGKDWPNEKITLRPASWNKIKSSVEMTKTFTGAALDNDVSDQSHG